MLFMAKEEDHIYVLLGEIKIRTFQTRRFRCSDCEVNIPGSVTPQSGGEESAVPE